MRKPPSPRRSADDRLFRLGTGFFALLVVLLVGGIAFELYENSRLSIQKFGFHFWQTTTWDPVAGDFGALPFIWGTLYSSLLALVISTPIALGDGRRNHKREQGRIERSPDEWEGAEIASHRVPGRRLPEVEPELVDRQARIFVELDGEPADQEDDEKT